LGRVVHDAASFAAARSRREAGTLWSGRRAAAIEWRKSATPPAHGLVVPDQLSGLERVIEIAHGSRSS
jgi:2,4-dienoyl-CoA reductase-like NADH-dependent reductase (Old Yellow Enzyme family)